MEGKWNEEYKPEEGEDCDSTLLEDLAAWLDMEEWEVIALVTLFLSSALQYGV